jgi:probable phosphoglycerate mutase
MGSPPIRIYLARHGSVVPTWRGRLYGDLDVPLDPQGEAEARELAERLRPVPLHALACSDLSRARFGAQCIAAGRSLEPEVDVRLREISRGDWAGMQPAEVDAQGGGWSLWRRDPERQRPPNGESLEDLWARVAPALEALALRAAAAARALGAELPQAALVAHGWVLRCTAARALGLPLGQADNVSVPPAGLIVVDWPCGGLSAGQPILAGLDLDRPLEEGPAWYRLPGPRR